MTFQALARRHRCPNCTGHDDPGLENQVAHRTIDRIRQAWKDYGIVPRGRIARGINEVEAMLE